MESPPSLCESCSALVIQIPGPGKSQSATTSHLKLSESKDGAENGCQFCARIIGTTLGSVLISNPSRMVCVALPDQKMEITVSGQPRMVYITVGAAVPLKDVRVFTLPDDPLVGVLKSRPFTLGPSSTAASDLRLQNFTTAAESNPIPKYSDILGPMLN
ncbi:hypothetical protein RU639_013345 [Aspergillus parasiticus]